MGLPSGAAVTLSFWYLPTTNGNHMTIRLSYNGLVSTTSISSSSEIPQVSLYTPGAKNSIQKSLPAFPPLWINEVMPGNLTNLADRLGRYAPWIELYNAGTNAVNLGGFYLTDTYTNLANWAFPSNVSIPGGQFMVVFADGLSAESTPSELHTSFRLNPTTGLVALAQVVTNQPRVLDYLNYRLIGTNRSYGSLPDGQPMDRKLFSIPTPGGTNNSAFPPVQVFINEWMADNTMTLADPADNRCQDWFELYNAGAAAVDLDGFTLTDDLSSPANTPFGRQNHSRGWLPARVGRPEHVAKFLRPGYPCRFPTEQGRRSDWPLRSEREPGGCGHVRRAAQ